MITGKSELVLDLDPSSSRTSCLPLDEDRLLYHFDRLDRRTRSSRNSRPGLALMATLLSVWLSDAPAQATVPAHGPRSAIDQRAATLVRRSGVALNVAALRSIGVIHLKGHVVASGLPGTGDYWNQMGRMREASGFLTPPLGGGSGWDGKESWTLDQTGLVIIDGSALGRSTAVNQAYLSNYDLWTPRYGGATVVWDGARGDKGKIYDVLTVTPPKSSVPLDIWFDRATHLPVKAVQKAGPAVTVMTLADFKPVDGLMIPYRTDISTNTGNSSSFTATSAEANPPGGTRHLAIPSSAPHDFSMNDGERATTAPIQISENHVYLSVMLDGKGPFRFEFDTGGANVIDPAVVKALKLGSRGSTQVSGVGAGTSASSFAIIKVLQIGSARITNQVFVVFPIRKTIGTAHAAPIDGFIGYEVLSRFVTTFDYEHETVTLHMPGSYTPPPDSTVIPILMYGTQPQFGCRIDEVPTICTVDTGATQSISLFTPFIDAHPGVLPRHPTALGVNGFGVGGPSMGRLGRVRTLSFNGLTLRNLVGMYSTQSQGELAMPFIGANIGGGVWKRFTMTLDYRRMTMTLKGNADFHLRDHWDRSGAYLIDDGAVTIIGVRPGTPAAKAGLADGDIITSVNGSSRLSLRRVRDAFSGKPGTIVHLIVKSKGRSARTVDLTLANYV